MLYMTLKLNRCEIKAQILKMYTSLKNYETLPPSDSSHNISSYFEGLKFSTINQAAKKKKR